MRLNRPSCPRVQSDLHHRTLGRRKTPTREHSTCKGTEPSPHCICRRTGAWRADVSPDDVPTPESAAYADAAADAPSAVISRALAREIRAALLEALPPTVTVEGLAESEETHPDAHGPEPFAPLHEYTYRASGRITGQLPDVLEIRRRARERDFVEVGALRLEGRMLPQ